VYARGFGIVAQRLDIVTDERWHAQRHIKRTSSAPWRDHDLPKLASRTRSATEDGHDPPAISAACQPCAISPQHDRTTGAVRCRGGSRLPRSQARRSAVYRRTSSAGLVSNVQRIVHWLWLTPDRE
jgi:hypothetical protein